MDKAELKARTKKFALRVIKMVDALPKNMVSDVLGKQILRSATSVAANYRASLRGRSTAEFISKIGIVEEEADETLFWLEMITEAKLLEVDKLKDLIKEADELTAIFTSIGKTAKINKNKNVASK
jgi:four helix bundle protein